MSDDITQETDNILDRQNTLFVKGDVDGLMKDFSEQANLFTPDGVLEGIDNIRKFYNDVIVNYLPPSSDFNLLRQEIRGHTAYIVWNAESENYRFPIGTDTFIIKDGKIIAPDVCGKIEPKN